jgi:hypothetical protein
MIEDIGITTIVTESVVEEFAILKYSFELFHGPDYRWFVRCDRASLRALSAYDNVSCAVFAERHQDRPEGMSEEFLRIVSEKMNVIDDAWKARPDLRGVLYLDADVIFTAPLMDTLRATGGDLILTPNHYPVGNEHLVERDGEFNAGFVFTRSRALHRWWQEAFAADPIKNSEQVCLNAVRKHFSITCLGPEVNVGFWRSLAPPAYEPIPADCACLHVHLFQPLFTLRQWLDKSYASHCMHFLMVSPKREHRQLFDRIMAQDRHGWLDATLRVCGAKA